MRSSKEKDNPNIPELDEQAVAQMLDNIFEACNVDPNTIPLEVLTSYSNYRKERHLLQRLVSIIVLICFILLPLLFIAPHYTVETKTADDGQEVYEVAVTTPILPIKRVTAEIDGHNVAVYEKSSRAYQIEPTANGEMLVTVELFNRQYIQKKVTVDSVDKNAPKLISNETIGDSLVLKIQDEESGVDFNNIYGTNDAGETVYPTSYDENAGTVTFDYPDEDIDVYIQDHRGNILHLLLSKSN